MKRVMNVLKTAVLRLCRFKVDKNQWLFSSSNNEKFNYNSKYLFEYVLEHRKDIKPLFVINDPLYRQELEQEYGEGFFIDTNSTDGIIKALKSGVWLSSAGFPLYGIGMNKRRMIVNLWHGIPLKRIGLLQQNLNWRTRKYFKIVFSNNYSYVVTTSESLVPVMAESFGVSDDKVKVWGQSRNDLLFETKNSLNGCWDKNTELNRFDKIVLYAPTFRDNGETLLFPFEDYDQEDLDLFLEINNIGIFIRTHQFERAKYNFQSDNIHFINEDKVSDIMEVLAAFDALITDYSSVYLDYLLCHKPVLFVPYDLETYQAERGFNFVYEAVTPGPKISNYNDFKEQLILSLFTDNYYSEDRLRVNNMFNTIQKKCSHTQVELIIEAQSTRL